ncbi:MAG: DUF1214 domain-containing protein [Hyphomonadaceae bacterium]
MRTFLIWTGGLLLGVLLGAGSALAVLGSGGRFGNEQVGQWTYNRLAGSNAADLYTRAIVARVGLLALSQRETIYFNLNRDELGHPLRAACRYSLTGGALPARWWSITLYAADHYLARNSDNAHSIDASRVGAGGDGAWTAYAGPTRDAARNWISTRGAGDGFSLTLRLYNPDDQAREQAHELTLPSLRAVTCEDGQ